MQLYERQWYMTVRQRIREEKMFMCVEGATVRMMKCARLRDENYLVEFNGTKKLVEHGGRRWKRAIDREGVRQRRQKCLE